MRTILNISVPEETAKETKRMAREEGCASMSEYFRHLLREEKKRKLAAELRRQERSGKWIKLHSLKDLR